MSKNTTVYVCQTCGELVPLGCCTCGPRQQLRALEDERSKMNETKMIEQALATVLDEFDFARVARYMRRTDWLVENLHDGAQYGEHSWLYPGPKWLREYVERGTREHIIEGGFSGWIGLGFNVYLATYRVECRLFVRFTDTRPIIVTGHQEVKGARCVEPHNPWRELWEEVIGMDCWNNNGCCRFCGMHFSENHKADCLFDRADTMMAEEVT